MADCVVLGQEQLKNNKSMGTCISKTLTTALVTSLVFECDLTGLGTEIHNSSLVV